MRHSPPAPLPLKALLAECGMSQAQFARRIGVSAGTLSDLINWHRTPRSCWQQLAQAIERELQQLGVDSLRAQSALHQPSAAEPQPNPQPNPQPQPQQETDVLLSKQSLTAAARAHFELPRDPFNNDIATAADVWVSGDIRYLRETLWQQVRHGGLLALVGESGSGKTTLVAEFKDRLAREGRDVIVIEPSVLYMEENDSKGKTLKSADIVLAILATVAPTVSPRRSPEARARQLHKLLSDGHRSGSRYLLLIEEAHCLPLPTLKHLKRFAELRDGLAPLLSIVLVGQPELRQRLAINNAEVREVAQRCAIVELPALGGHLGEYLQFKLQRIGVDIERVITRAGLEALQERLSLVRRAARSGTRAALSEQFVSLAYPLAAANALTAAMNLAAALGAPVVDEAIVAEV